MQNIRSKHCHALKRCVHTNICTTNIQNKQPKQKQTRPEQTATTWTKKKKRKHRVWRGVSVYSDPPFPFLSSNLTLVRSCEWRLGCRPSRTDREFVWEGNSHRDKERLSLQYVLQKHPVPALNVFIKLHPLRFPMTDNTNQSLPLIKLVTKLWKPWYVPGLFAYRSSVQ